MTTSFDIHLGETVAPYVALAPRTAVLPLSKTSMEVSLDHSRCTFTADDRHQGKRHCILDVQSLSANMRSRWRVMERLWDANKGKNDRKSLFERLNYHNSLTSQLEYLRTEGPQAIRVAYGGWGRPTAALIEDSGAILDYKLFQVRCESLAEAHYLLAIINSVALENAAVPFMTKGQFGARDLQSTFGSCQFPNMTPAAKVHLEIARLGAAAGKSANERISVLRVELGDSLTVTKARRELRAKWQKNSPDCQAIEELVEELLQSSG